ncbi:hypothetical protein [Priestia megaterium]|uniref:Uncharacterized protein n=1 Tax=Priestia megaterium TaxID=1404 RepID=A0A6M6E1G2_PRIMG|nr:hypothetical protein [Priestia megaterium]QJX80782.1 hypothetical protein FDZ14_32345 [Priestia megaterium]
MNFLKKNKFKNATYFYLKETDIIILFYKDYLLLRDQFPLHSLEVLYDLAIIQLSCPLKNYYSLKNFYHFGEKLSLAALHKLTGYPLELKAEKKEGSPDSVQEENVYLQPNFDPCNLCMNELTCMFSTNKETFQPKQYDILYFLTILKENRLKESESLYQRFLSYIDSDYEPLKVEHPPTWFDLLVVSLIALPIVLLYYPVYCLISSFQFIVNKLKCKSFIK